MPDMLAAGHQLKVFDSIIGFIPIFVVHMLSIFKESPEVAIHNESMLSNIAAISSAICHWMPRHIDKSIAPSNKAPSIPCRCERSSNIGTSAFQRARFYPWIAFNKFIFAEIANNYRMALKSIPNRSVFIFPAKWLPCGIFCYLPRFWNIRNVHGHYCRSYYKGMQIC